MVRVKNQCAHLSMSTVVSFNMLHAKLNKRLSKPKDVDTMNAIKLELPKETAVIDKKIEENNKLVFYLIDMDTLIDADLSQNIADLLAREKRFKIELEDIDKMHSDQRMEIEKEHQARKKRIESESKALTAEVNGLDTGLQLEKYANVLEGVNAIKTKVLNKKEEIDDLLTDEDYLYGYRQHNFETFQSSIKKIERFYVFWSNANGFYKHRKEVIVNFSEDIDFGYSLDLTAEASEIIGKEREKARNTETDFLLYSSLILDEIAVFRRVSEMCKQVFNDGEFNDEICDKAKMMARERKVDFSSKQILYRIVDMRYVEYDSDSY